MTPLATFLRDHDIRQAQVARAIKRRQETVNRWCLGHTVPSRDSRVALLGFLRRFDPELRVETILPVAEAA